jgi:DNA-binding PadR family transcriptional regulator
MFRYLVLGLLRQGRPLHGYALMKEYRARSGVRMSTGSLYRELQRLTAEGFVQAAANPDGADARRAPYEITAAGAGAFDDWLATPGDVSCGTYENGLSVRVLFVAHAEPAVAHKILDHWRQELWICGKLLERDRDAGSRGCGDGPSRPFDTRRVLVARRIKHIAADLEFLDQLCSAYEEWLGTREAPAAAATRRRARKSAPQRGFESAGAVSRR